MSLCYGCVHGTVRVFMITLLLASAAPARSSRNQGLEEVSGPRVSFDSSDAAGNAPVLSVPRNNLPEAAKKSSDTLAPVLSMSTTSVTDFTKTVIPITEIKLFQLGLKFGTGFCLDPECRFVGTNYHVAMIARPNKIAGERVVQRYLATGPDDEGATINDSPTIGPLKFTMVRDLAIFELRHPLAQHHGAAFSIRDLYIGQGVDIYAYPKEPGPIRNLVQFHGTFKGETSAGLLAFDYDSSGGRMVRPGSSGGIVVDSKSQEIVGVLNGVSNDQKPMALAVPIQSLVDFLSKVQPCLAQRIFSPANEGPQISKDLFPKFTTRYSAELQHRQEEPVEVRILRSKAEALADGIRNFIAVQTFAWGSGNRPASAEAAYQIRVIHGYQRFREYPGGVKESDNPPLPLFLNDAISTGGEWAELPEMVGTALKLIVQYIGEVNVGGRPIRVFQYRADPEDRICRFNSIKDFGLFSVSKIKAVGCYGEVWTDSNTNILRISEHYELPGVWKNYESAVTYGWLHKRGDIPRLVPVTISAQAEHRNKVYWCRGGFVNYQVFTSGVKMLAKSAGEISAN